MSNQLEEQQLMRKLGIYLVRSDLSPPEHISHTFKQIREAKKYEYMTYCANRPGESQHYLLWRTETQYRAMRIADTAATLKSDTVSEMEWRLRVEELVLARFRGEIDW